MKKKSIAIILSAIVILALGLLIAGNWALHNTSNTTPSPQETPQRTPFLPTMIYSLNLSNSNIEVIQGNVRDFNVTVVSLQGQPENIALSTSGLPDHATCIFNPSNGTPTNSTPFTSVATINIPNLVQSGTYNMVISATTDSGTTRNITLSLAVLNSQITVSGTITGGAGFTETEIIFAELSSTGGETGQTYIAMVESGFYNITLPNHEFFAVSDVWTKSDGTSGTHHFIMPYGVFADIGVSSINCPFSWG